MSLAGMGEIGWILGWIGLKHNVWFARRNWNWLWWRQLVWNRLAYGVPSEDSMDRISEGEGWDKVIDVRGFWIGSILLGSWGDGRIIVSFFLLGEVRLLERFPLWEKLAWENGSDGPDRIDGTREGWKDWQ